MADMAHVGADLVGASGLKDAFHQSDIAEALQHTPVRHGVLAAFRVVGDVHDATVLRRPFQIAYYRAFVFVKVPPYQGVVFAFDGVFEELPCQHHLCILVLGNE